jgi:hypothetical protein
MSLSLDIHFGWNIKGCKSVLFHSILCLSKGENIESFIDGNEGNLRPFIIFPSESSGREEKRSDMKCSEWNCSERDELIESMTPSVKKRLLISTNPLVPLFQSSLLIDKISFQSAFFLSLSLSRFDFARLADEKISNK